MFGFNLDIRALLQSARTIVDSWLGLLQNRLELFSAELIEERERLFRTILSAAALAAFGILGLVLFTITVVFAFWDSARLSVLIGLTLFYFLATFLLYRKLKKQLRDRPLSASIDELRKDRACLNALNSL